MLNNALLPSVKEHANVFNDVYDALLLDLIGAAIELIESIATPINYKEVNEPCALLGGQITVSSRPNNGIVNINGTFHKIDFGKTINYSPNRGGNFYGSSFATPQKIINVSYTCGYKTIEEMPYKIRAAIRMIVLNMFEHRGDGINRQDVGSKRTDVNNSILDNSRVKDLLKEYIYYV